MADSTEELTISKLVDLPKLRVYDGEIAAFEERYPFTPTIPIIDKNTYVGIEVEVENARRFDAISPFWTITEDGSLRNSGREFISLPIKAHRVEHALNVLFNNSINADIEFTERTSIHIHMNIRTLTVAQLEALVMTYMVFEKAMFTYAGETRYNNIFCVPLVETNIGKNLSALIEGKHPHISWQKYTALNLLPIMDKGTIEFRHLGGTGDINRIVTWINLILSLKKFALQKTPKYIWERIESLNTTSEYKMFGDEVFGDLIHLLWNDSFNTNVGECVSHIKLHCIDNPFRRELMLKYMGKDTSVTKNTWDIPEGIFDDFVDVVDNEQAARISVDMNRFFTNVPTQEVQIRNTVGGAEPPPAPRPRGTTTNRTATSTRLSPELQRLMEHQRREAEELALSRRIEEHVQATLRSARNI